MTVLNLIATLVRSVAMKFSAVIATLLAFTIFLHQLNFKNQILMLLQRTKIVCIWNYITSCYTVDDFALISDVFAILIPIS